MMKTSYWLAVGLTLAGTIAVENLVLQPLRTQAMAAEQEAVKQAEQNALRAVMGDVDVWAGLNTPAPKHRWSVRDDAKLCLALNAYHEARGEPFEGQIAVNQVALRRAKHELRKVCAEVYKPGQFSWTTDRPRGSPLPRGETWQWALAAAEQALVWSQRGEGEDFSEGATHYHTFAVNPRWNRNMVTVALLGGHRFLRSGI